MWNRMGFNGNNFRRGSAIAGLLVCALVAVLLVVNPPNRAGGAPGESAGDNASVTGLSATSSPASDMQSDRADEDAGSDQLAETSAIAVEASASYGNVDCEAGVVLVDLVDWMTPDGAVRELEGRTGLSGFEIVEHPAGTGSCTLSLPAGMSVDEALAVVADSSIASAVQPNFVYYVQNDEVDSQDEASSRVEAAQAASTAELMAASPIATAAEAASAGFSPNDPRASNQWAIGAMELGAAWKIARDKGAVSDEPKAINRTVALLDEGFDIKHEDLAALVVGTYDSYRASSGTYSPSELADVSPLQSDGHGTHVAGIVGAQTNNGVGVAGVSYNAQLLLIRAATKAQGSSKAALTSSSLATGINYVIDTAKTYNTHVISASVGAKMGSLEMFDKKLTSAIDRAYDNDIVFVASGGNSTDGKPFVNYPSDYPKAVSVINLEEMEKGDDKYSRYHSSNYNMDENDWNKDISAPGASIYSLNTSSWKYGYQTGTSMAAPQVAGVLSLMFAVNPELGAAEAVDMLYSTTVDLNKDKNRKGTTFDSETGYGLVNARTAVEAALRGGGHEPDVEEPATITRIEGRLALDTMRQIVLKGQWGEGGTVVLVTDGGYWDGLTANGIAGLAGAPIVMTNSKTLSTQARQVLETLRPKTVILVGGPLALSQKVYDEARAAAGTNPAMWRLSGEKADATACDLFSRGFAATGQTWSSTAFICTDSGFWDALSAAPISYVKHMPIFLTSGLGARLSADTLRAMKEGGITKVYIVGGADAVSADVEKQLSDEGIELCDRIWGDDAVETSDKVASFGIEQGLSANNLGVATSSGYWDALAGAAFCGKLGSVLVVVNGPDALTISSFAFAHKDAISQAYLFGGPAALDPSIRESLAAALAKPAQK